MQISKIEILKISAACFGDLYGSCDDVTDIVVTSVKHGISLIDTGYGLDRDVVERQLAQAFR